jgi:hypothetical protein
VSCLHFCDTSLLTWFCSRIVIAALDTAVLLGTLVLELLALLAFVRVWRSSGHETTLLDLTMRIIAFALLISVALAFVFS